MRPTSRKRWCLSEWMALIWSTRWLMVFLTEGPSMQSLQIAASSRRWKAGVSLQREAGRCQSQVPVLSLNLKLPGVRQVSVGKGRQQLACKGGAAVNLQGDADRSQEGLKPEAPSITGTAGSCLRAPSHCVQHQDRCCRPGLHSHTQPAFGHSLQVMCAATFASAGPVGSRPVHVSQQGFGDRQLHAGKQGVGGRPTHMW